MGTPPKLLLLIQTVLEYGSTFIRGAPDEIFRTTHGVKQGCPLSCFLFVLVFEIPPRFLASQGVVLSAFVDDVSTPIPPKTGPHTAALVQRGLNLIGCQLNVSKSECLPLISPQPPPPPSPITHTPSTLSRLDPASGHTCLASPYPIGLTPPCIRCLRYHTSCTSVTHCLHTFTRKRAIN